MAATCPWRAVESRLVVLLSIWFAVSFGLGILLVEPRNVFSRLLEIPVDTGVVIGMALVFLYATPGGMRGITYTQVAQYAVLIVAHLIPARAQGIGTVGMLLNFAVTLVVSRFTPAPPREVQELIEEIRLPHGS